MSAALKIATIFSAVDKFSAPMRKMSNGVASFAQKAEAQTARANRAFRSVTSPVRKLTAALGSLGVMVGGAAIVQGFRRVVGVFMDFEQANANLASVMGKAATTEKLAMLNKDAQRLGATTAKTATEVVQLQEAFARLGFVPDQITEMTGATINGSVAMNAGLSETAELAGAVVNTFTDFSAIDADQILDQMTLATQKSALNFEKLSTAIPIVGGAANAAGIGFGELLSLLGKLSDAGIDASMSSNALKNIFIESAGQGLNYTQILEKIKASSNKLTTSFDELGKRPAVAGTVLAEKLSEIDSLTTDLNENWKGTAAGTAATQLNTLGGRLTILGSAYEGFILSLEDGTGAYSNVLKNITEVITEVFSLASGTVDLTVKLDDHQKKVRLWAERVTTAVKIIGFLVAALLTFKAIILVVTGLTWGYNVAVGVYNALFTKSVVLTSASNVAQKAYMLTTKAMTAALWLYDAAQIAFNIGVAIATGNMAALNAIMLANPIGLIIGAIVILIALVAVMVVYWDKWGAALSVFLGPIGLIISMVQSFRRNWDMIGAAFSNDGIGAGLWAIGKTLLDAILMPLQQILEIASNIGGEWGEMAAAGAASIEKFRTGMGVTTDTSQRLAFMSAAVDSMEQKPTTTDEKIDPAQARQENLVKTLETTNTQNVNIGITGDTSRATVESDNNIVPVTVTNTVG